MEASVVCYPLSAVLPKEPHRNYELRFITQPLFREGEAYQEPYEVVSAETGFFQY